MDAGGFAIALVTLLACASTSPAAPLPGSPSASSDSKVEAILTKYTSLDHKLLDKVIEYTEPLLFYIQLETDHPYTAGNLIGTKLDVQSAYWLISHHAGTLKGRKSLTIKQVEELIDIHLKTPCAYYHQQMLEPLEAIEKDGAALSQNGDDSRISQVRAIMARYAICTKVAEEETDWLAIELFEVSQQPNWKPTKLI